MNRAIACAIHTRYHKCGQISTTHDTKARGAKNATNQKKLNKKTFDKPFPQRVQKHTHKCQQTRQTRKCAYCVKEHKPTLANVDMRDKTGNALAVPKEKYIRTPFHMGPRAEQHTGKCRHKWQNWDEFHVRNNTKNKLANVTMATQSEMCFSY